MGEGKPIRVEVNQVLREALDSMQPGEDVDLALRRVVQARYPDQHEFVFSAISNLVGGKVEENGLTREQTARQIAQDTGKVMLDIAVGPSAGTTKMVWSGDQADEVLEQLPPDLRAQVEEAMKSGKTSGEQVTIIRKNRATITSDNLEELPPVVREHLAKKLGGKVTGSTPPVVVRESKGCLGVVLLPLVGIVVAAAMAIR